MKMYKKLIGTSMLTAITASLCCITPLLALIAGTTGLASTLQWLEPFRPYLITITVIVISYAWFEKLKPKAVDITCHHEEKAPKFVNSKRFLGIITVFVLLMLSFPYYSNIFNSSKDMTTAVMPITEQDVQEATYSIKGMTCSACEGHIENEVNKLPGILYVKANYDLENTVIRFDHSQVAPQEIKKAIKKTGYIITKPSLQKWSN